MSSRRNLSVSNGIHKRTQIMDITTHQNDHATNAENTLEEINKSLLLENELLLLQLHQVQEELESNFLLVKQHEKSILALEQKINMHTEQAPTHKERESTLLKNASPSRHELDNREQSLGELNNKLDDERHARQALEKRNHDLSIENELMLLQLRQVQEELERLFMKNQEAEMKAKKAEGEFFQARNPDFCTISKLTVLGGSQTTPYRDLNCLLEELQHGERSWGKVNAKLLDTSGKPGLEFRKGSNNTAAPLQRWVESGKDNAGNYMIMQPADADKGAIFTQMPTSDWLLVNGLVELLSYQLRTGQFIRSAKAENIAIGPWTSTARTLQQQLRSLPGVFRFDDVKLREANVSIGYEHLWLDFTNVQFVDRYFPSFNFKLAAKEVKGDKFTKHATLVFRNLSNNLAPLDAWPPAKSDKFGPILQLEFVDALSKSELDDWRGLTNDDRAFIAALLARLPDILAKLEAESSMLKRPWKQWHQLVALMQPINNTSSEAPAASIVPIGKTSAPAAQVEKQLSDKLLFSEIVLGEVNRRPDYEHLRLDFKNLHWQAKKYPAFSFRLAATDVREGRFTGRMLLAFRELSKGAGPLECWPHAVVDQHGPVVRLAFGGVLTEAEQADWARLTKADQSFVNALLLALPDMLNTLQKNKNGKSLNRDITDWLQLIQQQMPRISSRA